MSDVLCLADLGGGRLLSGSDDRSLRVWDTATGACLAVVQNAHGAGVDSTIRAACTLPSGAATGSSGGSVQRWKWDEGTSTLAADGAVLQLESGGATSLAASSGPDGALQLLVGCFDGTLRVLGNGAGGELQQQAALVGHSHEVNAAAVMTP